MLAIYHTSRDINPQILKRQTRGTPILGYQRSRTEYCRSCRVGDWDKRKADAENWSLIPHRYKKEICADVDKVCSSRIAPFRYAEFENPCKNAHVPSKRPSRASWRPLDQRKMVFLGQLSFQLLQIRFAMRCRHRLPYSTQMEGWGSRLHPRRLSVSSQKWLHRIWALRQYSSKQIACDHHAHAHSASPPRHNTVVFQTVFLGWGFEAGK